VRVTARGTGTAVVVADVFEIAAIEVVDALTVRHLPEPAGLARPAGCIETHGLAFTASHRDFTWDEPDATTEIFSVRRRGRLPTVTTATQGVDEHAKTGKRVVIGIAVTFHGKPPVSG